MTTSGFESPRGVPMGVRNSSMLDVYRKSGRYDVPNDGIAVPAAVTDFGDESCEEGFDVPGKGDVLDVSDALAVFEFETFALEREFSADRIDGMESHEVREEEFRPFESFRFLGSFENEVRRMGVSRRGDREFGSVFRIAEEVF